MSTAEQAPPEGALIRLARKARGLSVKEAAKLVPIRLGESRWYHLESGTEGKGKRVIAPPETLAHMAHVVGVSPERLESAGRDDAAEILREILRQSADAAHTPAEVSDVHLERLLRLWPRTQEWQRRLVLGVLEETLSESPANSGKPDRADERRSG